ncbi:cation diffusion facilitator family transporter [Photobacterium halotolerans]|uniref:Cation diffusion facilitator family transporter n=1 Tax=Photobacterium halotolerans TaxID=265726 RepID=A0A7X4WB98_9GAMM|nr:cation diffusion facilitator family transporter [Photobacterium halotolerans]NAW65549.1 cation diffusion facilitator family transporter [Photobacterium halotolerans]
MSESSDQHHIKGKAIRTVTLVGAVLNVFLAVLKIGIGKVAGSQALVADGVHSLSDLMTDTAIMVGSRYWTAPADSSHPYGHGKFETLTNAFIGLMLALVGIGIGWDAIETLSETPPPAPGMLAFYAAVASIVIKELLFRWTMHKAKHIHSGALRANAWHHRSDALSSVPVAVAVIANAIFPSLKYLDQIAALLVTGMILKAAYDILWPAFKELTDARGSAEVEKRLVLMAEEDKDIREIHAIRSRQTGGSLLLDCHILVDPEMSIENAHTVSERFKQNIITQMDNVIDVVIHIEPYTCEERLVNPCSVDEQRHQQKNKSNR